MILEHILSTQNNFILSKKVLDNSLDPQSFKCTFVTKMSAFDVPIIDYVNIKI